MTEKFPKPLDQVIEEEHEVERIAFEIDEDSGRVTPRKVKEKVTVPTIYTRAPKRRISCADGQHQWFMLDRHRHIAKCRKCTKHRFLRAAFETIDKNGHIIDRATKTIID